MLSHVEKKKLVSNALWGLPLLYHIASGFHLIRFWCHYPCSPNYLCPEELIVLGQAAVGFWSFPTAFTTWIHIQTQHVRGFQGCTTLQGPRGVKDDTSLVREKNIVCTICFLNYFSKILERVIKLNDKNPRGCDTDIEQLDLVVS